MNSILQLKYAVEVEKTGSISKAAENLYMNQPNLSKAIRDLEDDLGIAIFDRTTKGVVPTEKGREFLGYARSILTQIAEMEALYKPPADQRVRFGVCVPRASYVSSAFTEFVRTLGPETDIAVRYRETDALTAVKSVAGSEVGIAVIRYQMIYETYFLNALAERSLWYEPVWEFALAALMSAEHPLAAKGFIEEADLTKYTQIVHGDLVVPALPVAEARQLAEEREKRRTISVYERGSQFELLSRIPSTYILGSPVPRDALDRFRLVQRACALPNNRYRDILIARTEYHYSRADRLFIEKLRQAAEAVAAI